MKKFLNFFRKFIFAKNKNEEFQAFEGKTVKERMKPEFVGVFVGLTAEEALREIKSQAERKCSSISTVYLEDKNKCFCGAVSFRDLLLADKDKPICDLAVISYPKIFEDTAICKCIPFFMEYNECEFPVLNAKGRQVGVFEVKSFADILESGINNDYAKLAGLNGKNEIYETAKEGASKRLLWLLVLLVMGMAVSQTIGVFEEVFAQLPVIVFFQSLVLDMAGNVGTQSLDVCLRVLSDGDVRKKSKFLLVTKEFYVGLAEGLVMGVLSFAAAGIYLILKGNFAALSFSLAACLGTAMFFAMIFSSLSGVVIPIFFKRIKIDPAVASGPFITTLNDLLAASLYYGLACKFLIMR